MSVTSAPKTPLFNPTHGLIVPLYVCRYSSLCLRDRVCSLPLTSRGGSKIIRAIVLWRAKPKVAIQPVSTFLSLVGEPVMQQAGRDVVWNTFYCILPFRSVFLGLSFSASPAGAHGVTHGLGYRRGNAWITQKPIAFGRLWSPAQCAINIFYYWCYLT